MTPVFGNYARYYDLLNTDKDYAAEAAFIQEQLRDHGGNGKVLLELGSGTGGHAIQLAKLGYRIHGVDRSPGMVETARKRAAEAGLSESLSFEEGDLRSYRPEPGRAPFDSVVSLFHVMSYQTENADLGTAFKTAANQLGPNGAFIFDCWYGPGVLSDPPQLREKRIEDQAIEVLRLTRPVHHPDRNVVDVHFEVRIRDKATGATETLQEVHSMRYLFKPEIELMLEMAGMKLVNWGEWLTSRKPGPASWNAFFVARRG